MFEEVSEPGLAGWFIRRTHVVPDADRDHRCLVVLMHDGGQAIGQGEAGEGNVDGIAGGHGRAHEAQREKCSGQALAHENSLQVVSGKVGEASRSGEWPQLAKVTGGSRLAAAGFGSRGEST